VKQCLPSVTSIGIAMVINGYDSLAMMIGAIIASIWHARWPAGEERYNVPMSSGIIAGASIAGLLLTAFYLLRWITLG
jgi:uncharacterized oligopeptide transporter (OPT) family protein